MFSQQQIYGINYYYSRVLDGSFDEDDVRLLLIHLREFLQENYRKKKRELPEVTTLLDAGDAVAHTVRTSGLLHAKIKELVKAAQRDDFDMTTVPHPLLDIDAIVRALELSLVRSEVIYDAETIRDTFATRSLDLQIALMSLLNGVLLKIKYDTIRDDFHFLRPEDKQDGAVYIRLDLDLDHSASLRQIRITAPIPLRLPAGNFGACILLCELPDKSRVEDSALQRTHSAHGYCEAVKALRINDRLVITAVQPSTSTMRVHTRVRSQARRK